MMAFALLLCIVLSELLSFSTAVYVYCPDYKCMLIEGLPCCGRHVDTLNSAPLAVKISRQPTISVKAGFPNNNQEESSPTCFQVFALPNDVISVAFTEEFALETFYPLIGSNSPQIIPQTKASGSTFDGNTCPHQDNLPKASNPYYGPKRTGLLDGAGESENPLIALGASFGDSDTAANDSPNTNNLLTNPNFNYGNAPAPASYLTQPSPVKVPPSFDTNLNIDGTVRFDGGVCTEDGCGVTPFGQLDNVNINTKRGTPVEFRA